MIKAIKYKHIFLFLLICFQVLTVKANVFIFLKGVISDILTINDLLKGGEKAPGIPRLTNQVTSTYNNEDIIWYNKAGGSINDKIYYHFITPKDQYLYGNDKNARSMMEYIIRTADNDNTYLNQILQELQDAGKTYKWWYNAIKNPKGRTTCTMNGSRKTCCMLPEYFVLLSPWWNYHEWAIPDSDIETRQKWTMDACKAELGRDCAICPYNV